MFRRRRTARTDWHAIEAGRVQCPLRGDRDVDNCFVCGHLVDVTDDDNASYIACRPLPAFPYEVSVAASERVGLGVGRLHLG